MQTYWILADSSKAARALIALNVPAAVGVRDHKLLDCIEDDTKTPPAGLIHTDTGVPIAIVVLS